MGKPIGQIRIEKTKTLIVEGQEDIRFFGSLLRFLNRADIQIISTEGKDKLRPFLPLLTKDPNFSTLDCIGIVRDADLDPVAAFQSVRDILRANGFSTPAGPQAFTVGKPRAGILILPDAQSAGSLEDLCLDSKGGDRAIACVESYFDCLRINQGALPQALSKAKVQAYLSSIIDNPTRRLGEAAEAGIWDWDNGAYAIVKTFLQQM